MVKLYINGTELTNFILSTPYKDTLDAELDVMNFQIKLMGINSYMVLSKNSKIRYYHYVSYNNTDYTIVDKTMCLFDWVETLEGDYWVYQLTCFSPTKLLEGIIINGMADTPTSITTLNTNMTSVVNKINKQQIIEYQCLTSAEQHPIELIYSEASNQPLRNYDANDFLWSGQMTAREILNEIAEKADCLVIGTDFNFSNGYLTNITFTTYKKDGSGIEVINDINGIHGGGLDAIQDYVKGLSISRNGELNTNNIVSLIHNAICKDNIQSEYLPARNDDLTIDDAEAWHILTDAPIYTLNQVKILANVNNVSMAVLNSNGTVKYSISPLVMTAEFDITNYIVEKDVFDAMSITQQSKHLYFIRGEKGIYGLFKKYKSGLTGLFSNTAMENIIDDIESNFPEPPATHGNFGSIVNPLYFGSFDSNYNTFTPASSMTEIINNQEYRTYGTSLDITPSNFQYGRNASYIDYTKNFLFSINYKPYADSVVVSEKSIPANTKTLNLALIKNQNDRTIDASKYYASQQSLVDRNGNDEMVLDRLYNVDKLAEWIATNSINYLPLRKHLLWSLGDYMTLYHEKWTIVAREIEQYSAEYIKVRFTLSKNYNARNSAINENRDKRLYGIPLNNYVDRFIIVRQKMGNNPNYKFLIKCWDDFTGGTTTQGYCLKDAVAMGNTALKDMVVAMKDNYAVDIERTTYSSTKVNVNLRYCNQDGTITQMDLIRDTPDGIKTRLSVGSSLGYGRLPFMNTSGAGHDGSTYTFDVYKDKMERIIFVFKNVGTI